MKKMYTMVAVLMLMATASQAQVGIGTTTPETTSMLDVTSTTKGFLMPRMTTAQRTAITSPVKGLQVFDITTNTVWFHNGTAWINNPAPDLRAVGTSHITQDAGKGGTGTDAGTSGQNIGIGFQTLNAITSGFWNVAAGYTALTSITSGNSNIAYGYEALKVNTSGSNNIAIGTQTLTSNTTASSSIAIGGGALNLSTGTQNTAVGHQALNVINSGTQNTAIGHRSAVNLTSGTGNIAVGNATSLASATGSNQLNIGNAVFGTGLTGTVGAPAGNIGIGTAAPNSTLHIAGSTAMAYAELTASATLTGANHFVTVNAAAATTITLPAVTGILGREYIVRNTGTGTVSIVVTGAGTINAGSGSFATLTANAGQTYTLYAGSANWQALLNVTNISASGAAATLPAIVLPASDSGSITAPGAGVATNVAFNGAGSAFVNSIQGASFNDTNDEITLPSGTYTVIWNFTGARYGVPVPSNTNWFWDVPSGASGTTRIHYGSGVVGDVAPYGCTFVTTMTITAARTFNFAVGIGSSSETTTYAVGVESRLSFVKIQ